MSNSDDEKPSNAAKNAGFENLKHFAFLSGESVQTLITWHKNKPARFYNILEGCKRHIPPVNRVVVLRYSDVENTPLTRLF